MASKDMFPEPLQVVTTGPFRHADKMSAYCGFSKTVMRRLIFGAFRRGSEPDSPQDKGDVDGRPRPLDVLIALEDRRGVIDILNSLDLRHSEVLNLRYFLGLTPTAIGGDTTLCGKLGIWDETLAVRIKTVNGLLSAARRAFGREASRRYPGYFDK